jgi:hydrogenase assembly chaperone HypC/HupF
VTARDLGPPSCHCTTCADEGVPMRVLGVEGAAGLARCAGEDGVASTVETTLVEPVAAGERVLVHAGVALVRLNDDESQASA